MVREIVLGLVFMLTLFGSEARTGVELNERTSVSTPAAKTTSPPQQDSSRLSAVGKVAGLGEFKVALLWDNRVKVAMTASDFEFERVTSDSGDGNHGSRERRRQPDDSVRRGRWPERGKRRSGYSSESQR